MLNEEIKKQYPNFIQELENDLHHKQQGYVKTIKIGEKIFPFCIPPQLEIILLDPEDKTIIFRPTSDPDSEQRKKGDWVIGKPLDAVIFTVEWSNRMKNMKRRHSRG